MRVAIPLCDGQFSAHFGRSDAVALAEVDLEARTYDQVRTLERNSQGCDTMPSWLASLAVERVLAGGIGAGAIAGLGERGIAVTSGFDGAEAIDVLDQFVSDPDAAGRAPASYNHHDEPGHEHHHCKHH